VTRVKQGKKIERAGIRKRQGKGELKSKAKKSPIHYMNWAFSEQKF
jgi:hypothetical protein